MQKNEYTAAPGPFRLMVVLGESTVEGGGWLAKTEERWADILHRLLETAQEQPLGYYNAGIGASVISPASPGYDASRKPSASERLQAEVIDKNPDLVIIAYGLNDMRAGMPVEMFRGEMEELIRRIREQLDPLIVITNVYYQPKYSLYPPFDSGSMEAAKTYNRILHDISQQTNCVYADVWRAEGEKAWVVHQDTVHANKIGNMLIAHAVFQATVHAAPGIAKNVRKRDAGTEWTKGCLNSQ
ncbi:SGNH/GDSL hydrolase family protein [candidate division KSB1 bacterium]|nr:SGNH/GDSL hydrolase family protein [candidate division KSB1 bacterium]